MPYISVFHRQMEASEAILSQVVLAPFTGRCWCTASRGTPRMMWMPNFSPMLWIFSAMGPKPLPPAAEGNRSTAGSWRPYSSKVSQAKGT